MKKYKVAENENTQVLEHKYHKIVLKYVNKCTSVKLVAPHKLDRSKAMLFCLSNAFDPPVNVEQRCNRLHRTSTLSAG